jgi:hypothetical protein
MKQSTLSLLCVFLRIEKAACAALVVVVMKLNNTRARSLALRPADIYFLYAPSVVCICVHVPLVDERESGFQKLSTAFVYLHLHLRGEFYVIPLSQCKTLTRNAIF